MSKSDKFYIIVCFIMGILLIIDVIRDWSNISFGGLMFAGFLLFCLGYEIFHTISDNISHLKGKQNISENDKKGNNKNGN